MTFSQAVLRALLAFVGFVVIQIITGMLVPMKPVALPHIFQWMLLSNAVVVTALSMVAVRTEWRGWKMGARAPVRGSVTFSRAALRSEQVMHASARFSKVVGPPIDCGLT